MVLAWRLPAWHCQVRSWRQGARHGVGWPGYYHGRGFLPCLSWPGMYVPAEFSLTRNGKPTAALAPAWRGSGIVVTGRVLIHHGRAVHGRAFPCTITVARPCWCTHLPGEGQVSFLPTMFLFATRDRLHAPPRLPQGRVVHGRVICSMFLAQTY